MAENEFYRLDLAVNITGDEQVKGKLRAMDNFIAHTKKQGEALNRMKASPAIHLTDRFTGAAQRVEQHMQRLHGVADALDRMKIAPLLSIRDNLTSGIMKADQVVKSLDMEQASPVITARDKVSSVVSRINAALEEIDKGHFSAAVEMRGDIINEAVQAKAALAKLDKTKAGPVADLKGELFGQLTKAMTEIRHLDLTTADPKASLRDLVTWKAREIGSTLRGLTSRAWTVTIKAKDQVANVARRITGMLTSPLGLLGAGAGAYGLGKLTVGAAAQFEQYTVAMEHWLKGNKALAQETMKWVEEFSDITPFTPEQLFPGMARAINIEKGMVEPAKRLVKLSGEMAALTPGKTVLDAMEALADAQVGEFERMKEFGMKITQEEFKAMGGWAGFLRKAEGIFAGGMQRLSRIAPGLLSTIIGRIQTLFRSAGWGMLEAIEPRLEKIVDWFMENKQTVDKWKNALVRFGRDAFEGILSWGERVFARLNKIIESPGFQKANWGEKIIILLNEMIQVIDDWVAGPGGKQVEKVFVKLAEIGTRAWLIALGGMVKGAGESLLHGNILGGIGLIAGAGLLGGGMLARGAWGLGKGALGLGRRIMGRGAVAGAGVAAETAATTEMATKGLNLGQVLREWFVTPASKRALEPIKQTVIPGTAETAARTVGGGWAPLRYIGKFGKVGNIISRAAIPLTLAAGAAEVAIARPEERVQTGLKVGGRIAGGLAGASLGAKAGAATGTLVAPGVGTLIGGAIGGLGGGIAGAIGGESVVKKISDLAKQVNFDALIDKTTKSFISLSEQVTQSWDKLKVNTLGKLTIIHDTVSGRIHEIVERAATEFSHLPENIGFVVGFTASKLVQLPGLIANLPEQIESYFSQIYTLSLQWAEQTVNSIITWFTNLPEQISTCWEQMVNSATIWGQQLYTSAITWVIQTVQGIFSWWSALPEQVSNWWAGVWSVVDTWASNTYSSVINWFSGIPGVIEKYISSTIDKITGLASLAWETIKGLGGRVTGGYKAGYEAARPHAQGGILTSPHLGLVAEAGPEAIIPLSAERRNQAFALWQQTGQMLGVLPHADGGIFGNILGGTKKAWNTTEKIFSTEKVSDIGNTVENVAIALESSRKGQEVTVKSIYKNYESRLKKATTLMEMEKIRGTAHEAINLSSKYRYIAKAFSRVILPLSLLTPVINIVSTSDKKQAIINEVGQILGSAAAGVISPFTAMSGAIVGAGLGAFGGQAIARNLYNKRIAKHAEGGFFIRPHLGLVAEAGPEAIIPLSAGKRSQAINLFQKVADILGLDRMGDLMTLEKGKTIQGFSEGTNIKNAFVYPVSAKLETATAKIVPLKPEFDIFTSVPEVGVVRQIGKKIKTNITEKINIMTEKLKEVIAGASSFATKLISSTKIIIEKTQQSMVAGFPGAFSRSKELISLVQSISPRFGLPPALLAAVIQAESSWNPRAISPMGAIGLTQVMPGTAKAMEYNPAELARNPALQIEAGAKYLSQMLWRFKSIPLAVAAYNAGPGAVEKYGGIPPYKETRVYVNRVMSMFAKHEVGGIFTKPHLGLVAEAGMEAIIPLSSRRRTRAMDLWQRAGIILGAIPAVPELSSRATINPILKAISRIPGVVGKTVLKPEKILPKIPELIDKAVINQVLKRLPISPNLAGKVVINPALRAVSKLPSLISSISQLPFNLGREQLQIVEHATGGILTRPHLGLIAEAGPEVVIPLSSRLHTHSLELWEQTGKYLGVKSYAQGGFMGGGFTEQLPVTNFKAGNKSINITVDGITVNMAGNEIDEEELAMKIGWQITKQIKKVLRNTA